MSEEQKALPERNKHHEKYKEQPWGEKREQLLRGPLDDSHRRCQDVICCLIFIAFIGGCVAVTALGFQQGNPNLVMYPYDEEGRQCGKDNTTLLHPYLYFYAAVENLQSYNITSIAQGVCVSSCPSNYTGTLNCVPTTKNPKCEISKINFYVSTPFLGRFCAPDPTYEDSSTVSANNTITINGTLYQPVPSSNQKSSSSLISLQVINTDELISWMTDLITCWPIILASVGFALVIVLVYMVFVRCCAAPIGYLTILLILAALIGLGYVFQLRAAYYTSIQDTTYTNTMTALYGLFYGLAGLWFIVILFMCERIRLSIALIEVTAEYISEVWSILVVPFIFWIISAMYYAYWVALSIYLYSSGTISKASGSFLPSVTWTSTTRYAWWYHLFALFYINAFINALAQFVLASSACLWYFGRSSEGGVTRPVSRSFWRAFRYHLGSIAFGSLLVAIIRFIMAIVEYFKQKIDTSNASSHVGKLYKCMLTCVQCCLECCARIMEFINKHAYIQCMGMIGFIIGSICMGIYGTSGDAMMHSYLLDEELNNKMPKSSPPKLQKFVADERN